MSGEFGLDQNQQEFEDAWMDFEDSMFEKGKRQGRMEREMAFHSDLPDTDLLEGGKDG